MILQDTLRASAAEGEPPKYSGRVNAEVAVEAAPVLTIAGRVIAALPPSTQPSTAPSTAPTTEPATDATAEGALEPAQAIVAADVAPVPRPVTQPVAAALAGDLPAYWGNGWVTVDEGRLVAVPVVQRFSNAVKKMNKADMDQPNERARLEFELGGDEMTLTQIHYASNVAVARGRGTVSLARDVDLTLNAGPLEKLQSMMGGVGDALGKATDAMSGYRVTGKLEDPKVQVELGKTTVDVAARKTGNAIGTGAKATTQGIGAAGKKVGGFLNKVLKKKQ